MGVYAKQMSQISKESKIAVSNLLLYWRRIHVKMLCRLSVKYCNKLYNLAFSNLKSDNFPLNYFPFYWEGWCCLTSDGFICSSISLLERKLKQISNAHYFGCLSNAAFLKFYWHPFRSYQLQAVFNCCFYSILSWNSEYILRLSTVTQPLKQ